MTIIVLLLFLITKRKPPKVNNYLSSALVTDATVNNIHSPRGLLGTPILICQQVPHNWITLSKHNLFM